VIRIFYLVPSVLPVLGRTDPDLPAKMSVKIRQIIKPRLVRNFFYREIGTYQHLHGLVYTAAYQILNGRYMIIGGKHVTQMSITHRQGSTNILQGDMGMNVLIDKVLGGYRDIGIVIGTGKIPGQKRLIQPVKIQYQGFKPGIQNTLITKRLIAAFFKQYLKNTDKGIHLIPGMNYFRNTGGQDMPGGQAVKLELIELAHIQQTRFRGMAEILIMYLPRIDNKNIPAIEGQFFFIDVDKPVPLSRKHQLNSF
jgi:hypothetical protein